MVRAIVMWICVGLALGLLGAATGPGIVMVMIALASASLGAVITLVFRATKSNISWIYVALTTLCAGLLIASPWLIKMESASVLIVGLVHVLVSVLGSALSVRKT